MEQRFTRDEVVDGLHRERRLFVDGAADFHLALRAFIDALLETGMYGESQAQAQVLRNLNHRPSAGSVANVAATQTRSARDADQNQLESQ